MNKPLALSATSWASRWLTSDEGRTLHRVAEGFVWGHPEETNPDPDEKIIGVGPMVCGVSGMFSMPGVFGRLGGPRCAECCRLMDIPEGKGNPYNKNILEPGDPPPPRDDDIEKP